MKTLNCLAAVALVSASFLVACGGDTEEAGGTGGDSPASGGMAGDGDGDVGGSTGGSDPIACTDQYVYGVNVIIQGGAQDSDPAPPPASGGATSRILPPSTGGGSALILPPDLNTGGSPAGGDACENTVVLTEESTDFTETLECRVSGNDCECFGAGERAGTYTATATWGDQQATATNIVVESDQCHVIPVTITLF